MFCVIHHAVHVFGFRSAECFSPVAQNPRTRFLSWALPPFPSSLLLPHYIFCSSPLSGCPLPSIKQLHARSKPTHKFSLLWIQPKKLPAVMSQQHKTELLVTERNCQEFGEDESPSKMVEKRQHLFSFLFVSQLIFVPGWSKEHNTGISLHLPIGRRWTSPVLDQLLPWNHPQWAGRVLVLMCCNTQSLALAPDVPWELNLTMD